jgi:hypothetical protein
LIRITRRAASQADLDATQAGTRSLLMNVLSGTLPLTGAIFAVVYIITRSLVIATGFAAPVLFGSLVSNLRFRRSVHEAAESMRNPNAVEVLDVQAERVLDIEPVGDHAPAYCFFVDDTQAVLVVGQWLLEVPGFPSLSFRLHRWADSGEPIRIDAIGPAVEPEHSNVILKPAFKYRDVELFHARAASLAQDLEAAFAR